jgi:hypothetical protein
MITRKACWPPTTRFPSVSGARQLGVGVSEVKQRIDPLEYSWEAIEKKWDKLPEIVNLPRDEFLRINKAMFYQGANTMCLGLAILENMSKDDPPSQRERILLNFMLSMAMFIKDKVDGNRLEQLLATVQAHQQREQA